MPTQASSELQASHAPCLHLPQPATPCKPSAPPLTCGSKPMSNMRSASSITRYVTRRRFVILPAFAGEDRMVEEVCLLLLLQLGVQA